MSNQGCCSRFPHETGAKRKEAVLRDLRAHSSNTVSGGAALCWWNIWGGREQPFSSFKVPFVSMSPPELKLTKKDLLQCATSCVLLVFFNMFYLFQKFLIPVGDDAHWQPSEHDPACAKWP